MTTWDLQQIIGVPKTAEIPKLLLECIAEAFGTFVIVFFGCGSALSPGLSNTHYPDVVQISLAFGLAVFVGAQITGSISGGYMNPAVTLAGLIVGRLSLIRSILFVLFQIVGGIAGAGILSMLTPHELLKPETRNLGMNAVHSSFSIEACPNKTAVDGKPCFDENLSVTQIQGLIMEHIVTMVFIALILNVTEPKSEPQWSPPMMIGLTVTLCHVLLIPYTGCSVNPARSLGPAVIQKNFKDQWIFWIGPLSGGLVAAINHIIVMKVLSKTEYSVNKSKSIRRNQIGLEENNVQL